MSTSLGSDGAPALSGARVPVLFFGRVADVFGRSVELELPADGCSISELKAQLGERVAGGAAALAEPGARWAVDRCIVREACWVRPGQEVAFFSVFSGG